MVNLKGEHVRTFAGQHCVFLDDGTYISASGKALRRFDQSNNVLWEIPGHFHHQINVDSDQKKILALSSRQIPSKRHKREDKLLIINLDGKIEHEQLSSALLKQVGQKELELIIHQMMAVDFGDGIEISHINSFYEIPEIKIKDPPEYLKKGNFIVNGLHAGVFILGPDLKKVLHHFVSTFSIDHIVHDVQVNKEGHYLFFNNKVKDGVKRSFYDQSNYSNVLEIDGKNQKLVHKFEASPKEIFSSEIMGSIQELDDDTWLISHFLQGSYIYSKARKEILVKVTRTHINEQAFVPTQQVKAQDLSKFFSNRKN